MSELKFDTATAMRLRPRKLPSVEPELQIQPPRKMVWKTRNNGHAVITPEIENLLVNGVPARAWILAARWDSAPNGPDIRAEYAFEHDTGLKLGHFHGVYETALLNYGHADFSIWLQKTFRKGGTLTILYPRGEPDASSVYGSFQLYLTKDFIQQVEKYRRASSTNDKKRILEETDVLLMEAIGPMSKEERDRYQELLARFADAPLDANRTLFHYVDGAINALVQGNYNRHFLEDISSLIRKSLPGLWAAQ